MKIAVVTDSASYLTPEQVKNNDIHVVPITVIFGHQTYLDNVEITTSEFYHRLKTDPQMPTTTQVTLGQMQTMYDQLADEGYDAVISIHLSSGITTFYSNLVNYLPNVTNIKVYPFDSRIASAGEADLVMLAAKLIRAGRSPEEIIQALTRLRDTIDAYFVVDDLSHLVRTGRLSNASSFVGGLLRIKPILTFNDQAQIVAIEKERTMRHAYQRIKQKFQSVYEQADYPLRLTVIDANNDELQQEWSADLSQQFPNLKIAHSEIGPVLGVHVGAGTMALLWDYDWEQWPDSVTK
ncbi:MAG TPA: DegV family protein [Lactobacillus sp.]|jgi:DegV family protein with EDD domain|uniref:DegV family protein n=1 Tax=Secundilactobacillus silagincola TaxID=1714681 RepID=A0A1Z5J2P9_9LACO|nr:DegV family protein [Secundilactobacillus silagincola]GAX08287.1 DegV family protein [Secundilactobacillus silagincola]HBF74816.1 DegV family protein [Lactobacillus sp.]